MIEAVVNTIALLLVAGFATMRCNSMNRDTAGCERWGFVLTAAGAIGHALAYWWPQADSMQAETILHVGLALIGFALVRGDLRAMLARAGAWDGRTERRAGR